MVVEILGAKMLSPYVGLSHFVWTAQIAVTLVALACGYYVGGRLADRSQRLAAALLGHPGRGALPGVDGAHLRAGRLLVPRLQPRGRVPCWLRRSCSSSRWRCWR